MKTKLNGDEPRNYQIRIKTRTDQRLQSPRLPRACKLQVPRRLTAEDLQQRAQRLPPELPAPARNFPESHRLSD